MTLSAIGSYDNYNFSGIISNSEKNNTLKFTLFADAEYTADVVLSNITGDLKMIKNFCK